MATNLEYELLIRPDKFGSIGGEMSQQLCTLLLPASNATILQLCGYLDQHLAKGRHDEGRVQAAESANYAHDQFPDAE